MNKKYLISIILSIAFFISPVTYAADISTPTYQVDVTHSAVDIGVDDPVAMADAKTMQSKNTKLNMTSLSGLHKPRTLMVACGYDSVEHVNVSGVFGGNSIGIGRPI